MTVAVEVDEKERESQFEHRHLSHLERRVLALELVLGVGW